MVKVREPKVVTRKSRKNKAEDTSVYEFIIKSEDILKEAHFGSFRVIKTKRGIMFANYTGYHVFTSPYAVGVDGVAHPNSLYTWLDDLLVAQETLANKLEEQFEGETLEDGTPLLNKDIFNMQKMVTEANLLMPLTAFIDVNKAIQIADEQMKWLTLMQEQLLKAMNSEAPNEDDAIIADAEESAKVANEEIFVEMLKGAENADI